MSTHFNERVTIEDFEAFAELVDGHTTRPWNRSKFDLQFHLDIVVNGEELKIRVNMEATKLMRVGGNFYYDPRNEGTTHVRVPTTRSGIHFAGKGSRSSEATMALSEVMSALVDFERFKWSDRGHYLLHVSMGRAS